jgi:flavin reductase (DIM6/NTAB) family NADH-FMN oxidoreductase RutF
MDIKAKQTTLRLLTNGIYVLTSRSGDHFGASTVTWVSQASFKPPLIMAAIRHDSNVLHCMKERGGAVLHIFDRSQRALAQKFFATTKHVDHQLNGEPYTDGRGSAPILQNLFAYLECKVVDIREEYGDHAIAILEVIDAQLRKGVKPLVVADSPWRYGG